jgi:hypothetical protein
MRTPFVVTDLVPAYVMSLVAGSAARSVAVRYCCDRRGGGRDKLAARFAATTMVRIRLRCVDAL